MIKKQLPKPLLLLILMALTFYTNAQAPTTYKFSIKDAVDFADKNNAQVKNALLAIKIQEQTNRGITAAAFPNLSGSAGITNYLNLPISLIPGEIAGQPPGTYKEITFGTKYTANAGLQLQQLLFDGQVFVGLQARSVAMKWKQKEYEITEEAIKVNIYKIYYQLVVSKSQIELLDANISRLEKLKHDINEIYKNGFAEKLDVDKLEVQLTNLQSEKSKALNSIDIGYLALKTLIGMPVKDTLVLTDKITDSDVKNGLLADSVDYTNRKEYQYLNLAKKLGEYNVRRYKLSYLPTVNFNASYSKQAQRAKATIFEKGDWFTTSYVGMNISVPIFSGFAKDARVKQAKLELKQTENTIDNLKLMIDSDTEQSKLKYKSATETMDAQNRNMALAEKVYLQTKKKYEAGTGSNTEITAAETELKTAQTGYISALYDAIIAKVDFLKATGKL